MVGTWWHSPEDNGYCSSAVIQSFIRTVTTSFGSICFGSLLVAILQALRAIANMAQAEGDAGIGACIAECILVCLQSILEYFNKVCTSTRQEFRWEREYDGCSSRMWVLQSLFRYHRSSLTFSCVVLYSILIVGLYLRWSLRI